MKKSSNKGFTLVELIIVIAILAIIMLIAIPNFSGIQQRMQVRADKATAAQIGKAVRVWFTDYTTDANLPDGGTKPEGLGTPSGTAGSISASTDYSALAGIETYITKDYRASSLKAADGKVYKGTKEGGIYSVFLTADYTSSAAKIAVAITSEAASTLIDGVAADKTVKVNYTGKMVSGDNGSNGGVAYVEP